VTFHGCQSQPSSPGLDQHASAAPAPPPRPPIPQRGSSLPARPVSQVNRMRGSDPMLGVETQGVYVNMSELAWMAASKAQEMTSSLPPPPPELTAPDRDRGAGENVYEARETIERQAQSTQEPIYNALYTG